MQFIREVRVRYGRPKKAPEKLSSAWNAAEFIRNKVIRENNKEHLVLLCLDGNHQVVAWNLVSVGTANSALVHPREVFQPAVLSGAVSIIIAHNHPSGNLEASTEDLNATKIINEAGKLLGIKLLDHIIISESGFISLQERGYIK